MHQLWTFIKEYNSDIIGNLGLLIFTICCAVGYEYPDFVFSRSMIIALFIGSMIIYPLNVANIVHRSEARARCWQKGRDWFVSFYEFATLILMLSLLGSVLLADPLPAWLNIPVIWGIVWLMLFAINAPKKSHSQDNS